MSCLSDPEMNSSSWLRSFRPSISAPHQSRIARRGNQQAMTFSTIPTVSMTNASDRVENITSVQRRRRWTAPEKVRMVEETFEPGMTVSLVQDIEDAARTLGLRLQLAPADGSDEIASAFFAMAKERADAFILLPSPMLFGEHQLIVDLAANNRLPGMYKAREFVDAGGLMSYGANLDDLFRRTATYVHKILKAGSGDSQRGPRTRHRVKKTTAAAAVAAEGRFPMKTVAEVIGVSRSNLADCLQERCKKRIGRPPLPADELGSKINPVVAELPTYGYRRVHAVLKRQALAA